MKRVLRTLIALTLLAGIGGAAIVGLGLYNVSARNGHLPGVAWLMHTAYAQSVRLRAPDAGEVPPNLDDPDRIALGEMHFRSACAFCHAMPGQDQSATALAMNPTPPQIEQAVAPWEPRHLFWIVREGVKMTGMPHWPATGRDDEIWSVVAYLQSVKTPAAGGGASHDGAQVACADCHGEAGRSRNSFVPRLDILTGDQIAEALHQYRAGTRASGIMQQAARHLSEAQIAFHARSLGRASADFAQVSAQVKASPGGELATRGSDAVPACTACHGPGRRPDQPIAPRIAGQSEAYLAAQLKLWREGARGGGTRAKLMRKAAQALDDDQIAELAAWFAALDVE